MEAKTFFFKNYSKNRQKLLEGNGYKKIEDFLFQENKLILHKKHPSSSRKQNYCVHKRCEIMAPQNTDNVENILAFNLEPP